MRTEDKQHLNHLKNIREGLVSIPKLSWGAVQLSIPMQEYLIIKELFPGLKEPNSDARHQAWKEFLLSPLSEPYKINKRDGRKRRKV